MKSIGKYLIEGIIILISILGAFWLEEYRDEKKDRKILLETLLLFENEIIENIALLDSITNEHYQIIEAISQITIDKNTYKHHSNAVIKMANFQPKVASINSLNSLGIINNIEDIKLRLLISSWNEQLKQLSEHEKWSLELRNEARKRIAFFGEDIDGDEDGERYRDVVLLNLLLMRRTEELGVVNQINKVHDYFEELHSKLGHYLKSVND